MARTNVLDALRELAQAPAAVAAPQPKKLFSGPIEKPTVSPLYALGMAGVALLMATLPVIYLTLVCAFGYLIYWHATENLWLLGVGSDEGVRGGRIWLVRLGAYAAPILMGVIASFFLVKPIFAPRGRHMRQYFVDRHEAPGLHDAVDQLCAAMGAPAPKRIDIDCSVNASAGFRRGWFSFFGNDLVLTIGLPLAAGLTQRQLIGVVAHEFGHFTQAWAMRLGYVINSINGWFFRVVYQRDAWDERLEAWAAAEGLGWTALILQLCRLCVWLSRRVLWVLMVLGHAVSCFLSRQMEFDADACETRACGSKAFASTMVKIHCLGLADFLAHTENQANFENRRLADNIPAHIDGRFREMPRDIIEKVKNSLQREKPSLFSTHPPPLQRMKRAAAENAEGVFLGDGPASDLFVNFDMLCRAATQVFYNDVIGPVASTCARVPWRELTPNSSFWNKIRTQGLPSDQRE